MTRPRPTHKPVYSPEIREARFWVMVEVKEPDECWPWKGAKQHQGYGVVRWGGEVFFAHRLAWVFTNGPVKEGYAIHHECRIRACCNPDHLREMTPSAHASLHRLPFGKRTF